MSEPSSIDISWQESDVCANHRRGLYAKVRPQARNGGRIGENRRWELFEECMLLDVLIEADFMKGLLKCKTTARVSLYLTMEEDVRDWKEGGFCTHTIFPKEGSGSIVDAVRIAEPCNMRAGRLIVKSS
jgi:hypothetical protein